MIGVTGVEDQLQDNVQSCIKDFIEADIKVFMVTGDKGATANHIGLSSGIFSKDMTIFTISENDNISSQLKTVENQML